MTQQEPRVPAGDYATARFAVEGNVAARRALEIGLVCELLPRARLREQSAELAQMAQVSRERVIKPEWTLP